MPPVFASAPKARSTTPFSCCGVVGTTWHSEHATGFERLPFTCAWCAPTPTAVVALLFLVSMGGAAFTLTSAPATAAYVALVVPWQVVHVRFTTSTVPLMCVGAL